MGQKHPSGSGFRDYRGFKGLGFRGWGPEGSLWFRV